MELATASVDLSSTDRFVRRHIGPSPEEVQQMLEMIGVESLDQLIDETVPESIRLRRPLDLPAGRTEQQLLADARALAEENAAYRSYIGMGYAGTVTPPPILRNILENPGWYTQYTPYQAEIAQGRLEMLLNFQTAIIDLTGLPVANASLLDEATAAAEAMSMFFGMSRQKRNVFLVAEDCHPQTIALIQTRAEPLGIDVRVGPASGFEFDDDTVGALVQYPATDGRVVNYASLCNAAHEAGAYVCVAADLMSLALLTPPGEFGADAVVGSSQRFGVPMGYGGPHAAFFATQEKNKRRVPGRIIGVSIDSNGDRALRMALQTREQHIRREKATSNICTAQVLLAVMAGAYAVYHGPDGLRGIATRIHNLTKTLAAGVEAAGHTLRHTDYFDTLRIDLAGPDGHKNVASFKAAAEATGINLRYFGDGSVGVTLDETVTVDDLDDLLAFFSSPDDAETIASRLDDGYTGAEQRETPYLTHEVFSRYHSETELMRYLMRLQSKDLSLVHSMIPLGSCTMKLNAAAEMMPVTMPGFGSLHPFAPQDQAAGYKKIFADLEAWLAEICGFAAVSLQPNSGAQGEYAGLLTIRNFHESNGDTERNVCLIPTSAHGTNPASAVMAGMKVVAITTDDDGNIDVDDLRAKADAHADHLAALMVTYPSTHGVFEATISEVCQIVHDRGGRVYMDGANMNAQVGLCRPGDMGADVVHLNLHKTFAIPHGGGGPGMGPICCTAELAPHLPGHPVVTLDGAGGPVSAAPWGSASILLISWAYIAMLGSEGVTDATKIAILNANYMAKRLENYYDVLYRGENGRVAHEFIIDFRDIKRETTIGEEDVAKRLMDYGYHAPTMSWPVVGTMMIEPTESESKRELDQFCDAMISIKAEIQDVAVGLVSAEDSALRNAPHTAALVTAEEWTRAYTRAQAAYPAPWTRQSKFWPTVGRVDNAYGDRN
ncbi:MAG: aminomethyl-transferring glycine dehydrogenase, partial [Bacteroidota bacterium]